MDSDCDDYPFEICSNHKCKHKEVFPIFPIEFVGVLILALIMTISIMAGIGGGGVVVSFSMIFFSFSTKSAIALSGITILACSITRFIFNIKQKHPEKDAVVIDYGLATVMLPTVLMGSLVGVFFNVVFPALIL